MNTSEFKLRLPDGYLSKIQDENILMKKTLLACLAIQSNLDGIDRHIEMSEGFKSVVSYSKDPFTLQIAKIIGQIELSSRLLPMDFVLQSLGNTLQSNGLISVPNSRDKAMPALLFYSKITNPHLNGKPIVTSVPAEEQDGGVFLCAKLGHCKADGDCQSL